MSHALIIRGHGAGLSRPGCEPRALDRSHPVSVRAAAHTRLVLQPQCAEGQIARALASDPYEQVLSPPDRTHPVGVGFDDFWQMTSVMGSSTAHSYGRRSPPPGAHG